MLLSAAPAPCLTDCPVVLPCTATRPPHPPPHTHTHHPTPPSGGLVTGTLIAYYFSSQFSVGDDYVGGVLCGANIIAGISSLFSG